MVRRWLAAVLALVLPATAFAACPTTSLTFKDASSATQTLCYGGASGAYVPNSNPIDASGNPITATLGATAPASGLLIGLKSSGGNLIAWPLGSDTLPEISASNLTISAGSTTATNLGSLIFGGAVSSAQAYTPGDSYPVTLTPGGALRSDWSSVGGVAVSLGPQLSQSSLPVVVATDQPPVPAAIARVGGWPVKTTSPGVQAVGLVGPVPVQPAGASLPVNAAVPWTPGVAASLSNTAVSIKPTPGQLGKMLCYNANTTIEYVQIFNAVAASVSLGTTVAVDVVPIPATANGGFVLPFPGESYGVAISFAATTTATGGSGPGTALTCAYGYN